MTKISNQLMKILLLFRRIFFIYMKSLKSILEGIMDRANRNSMSSDIHNNSLFGKKYKLRKVAGYNGSATGLLSVKNLKKLTANLKPVNDDVCRGLFAGSKTDNEKMQMFIKWLENIDLLNLGITDLLKDDEKKLLFRYLNQEFETLEISNNHRANVFVPSSAACGHDEIRIMIMDRRSNHWNECIQLYFSVIN